MNELKGLAVLLGEENEQKVKDGIANMIIEKCKEDLDSWDQYILYPPDFNDMIRDAYKTAQKEVEKIITEQFVKNAVEKLKDVI